MNLDIVIIDSLTPDGILTSFKVKPAERNNRVLIDRFRDVFPDKYNDELDLGGIRIYNSKECSILKTDTKIRNFSSDEKTLEFQFEHIGIPIGPSREGHGGIYNFLLPAGFKLLSLYVSDPYDSSSEEIESKKQFRYELIWDSECKMQLLELGLRSSRGSFSFIIKGSAGLLDNYQEADFKTSSESEWKIGNLTEHFIIPKDGQKKLAEEISKKIDWLDLKPNIFGIGLNINEIIKSLNIFKKKIKNE